MQLNAEGDVCRTCDSLPNKDTCDMECQKGQVNPKGFCIAINELIPDFINEMSHVINMEGIL